MTPFRTPLRRCRPRWITFRHVKLGIEFRCPGHMDQRGGLFYFRNPIGRAERDPGKPLPHYHRLGTELNDLTINGDHAGLPMPCGDLLWVVEGWVTVASR